MMTIKTADLVRYHHFSPFFPFNYFSWFLTPAVMQGHVPTRQAARRDRGGAGHGGGRRVQSPRVRRRLAVRVKGQK
jgi:hypothetical protein